MVRVLTSPEQQAQARVAGRGDENVVDGVGARQRTGLAVAWCRARDQDRARIAAALTRVGQHSPERAVPLPGVTRQDASPRQIAAHDPIAQARDAREDWQTVREAQVVLVAQT